MGRLPPRGSAGVPDGGSIVSWCVLVIRRHLWRVANRRLITLPAHSYQWRKFPEDIERALRSLKSVPAEGFRMTHEFRQKRQRGDRL